MPISSSWVAPEVFLEHNGVTVYDTYKDDDVDQGRNVYRFTTDDTCDENHFDVRELDVPSQAMLLAHPPFLSTSKPLFETASPETIAMWRQQWNAWHGVDGGEEQAIRKVLMDAIDAGLL